MASAQNPLLVRTGIPKFDEIKPHHIEPAVTQVLQEANNGLTQIESNLSPTWEGLILPLEEMGIPFEYAWGPIQHLLSVNNTNELRAEHEKMLPQVIQFGLRMGQSKPIYDGLLAIRDGPEWDSLNEAQRRVINLKIRDAKLAGVGLPQDKREDFNRITTRLSKLATDFSNNVLDSTKAYEFIIKSKAETEGWPINLVQLSSQSYNQEKKTDESFPETGPWRITLEAPMLIPFLRHSKVRHQREKLLKAYVSRADSGDLDNKPLIREILQLRSEKAKLLGYESFAEMSLEAKMAPDVEAVQRMFHELFEASKPKSLVEFKEIEEIAENMGQRESLKHWDAAFWSERLKEQRFRFTDDQLRPYFPFPRVLEGMFRLAESLFGVDIKESEETAPKWHPDVIYYKVYDKGQELASFYLDAYSRPGTKRGGAWMGVCLDRRIIDGKARLPVTYLNANATPPIGDSPSLLSFNEVTTLFHEFGHGLQAMLTTVDYTDVTGINGVEWDAVEVVSQFLELWCYHEPTLRTISGHWETGEPLPDELVRNLLETKIFRAATAMLRQLEFGMTDMDLHSVFNPFGDETPFQVHERISRETNVLPPMEEDHFLCAFGHIFAGGYAAGYYSYKWAEVLSADLYSVFQEANDGEDEVKRLGQRFRETFLEPGGSIMPMKLFKDFMGRAPSTEALLKQNDLL
jgi:oligopeptidase A